MARRKLDFSGELADTIEPTRGSRAILETLEDAARFMA